MKSPLPALAAAALAAACATPEAAEKQPFPTPAADAGGAWAHDPASPGGTPAAVAAYARSFPRPQACEEAARKLQRSSRERAWELLGACVARPDFTQLSLVIDGGWAQELKTRADASLLLTKVIASRGGDVVGDLARLRERRIPIFAIGAAVANPDVYRGRLVLFRAEPKDVKVAGAKATAELAEYAVGVSESYATSTETLVRRDELSYSSRRRGDGAARAERTVEVRRRVLSNVPVATGLEAIARLGQVDPFFEPGRQFLVLARFDGVRDEEGEALDQPNRLALVSVVAYYEPSPAMVE